MKEYYERYKHNSGVMEIKNNRAKQWYRDNLKRALLTSARRRAKRKQVEFSICEEDFEIPTHCPIYGIPSKAMPHWRIFACCLNGLN